MFFAIFKGKILNLGRGKDPGSGKKIIPDPDPWGKKAPDPGSATLNSQ
jgi:hypothetical protein